MPSPMTSLGDLSHFGTDTRGKIKDAAKTPCERPDQRWPVNVCHWPSARGRWKPTRRCRRKSHRVTCIPTIGNGYHVLADDQEISLFLGDLPQKAAAALTGLTRWVGP